MCVYEIYEVADCEEALYTLSAMQGMLERMHTERTIITPLVDRRTQLFGGTWTDRVGTFIDDGVASHINSHHMVQGYDSAYPKLVSDALLSGVASVLRHERPAHDSDTMHRVGDALLGAIEAYAMHLNGLDFRISSGISDFIAWDHPLETSSVLFGEIIDAVDRKVQRDGSGTYVYLGNQVIKRDVCKIAITQAIMAQIDAGAVSRRNQSPNERGISKWTQNISDSHKEVWYYALEKSISPWSDNATDIVTTRLVHPEFAVDAIRSGIAYLSGTAHDIKTSSHMLVSFYEQMVTDIRHTVHTTADLEHAVSARVKSHTISSSELELFRQRIIDYTQSLSKAESTDSHHVMALILLAKTLPLYTVRTQHAFDAIIRRGVFHHDPVVRRVCFNAMSTALETPGVRSEYRETLRKRVFYKLFPKEPTPQTAGYWQELISAASLTSIETWLMTASTSYRLETIGPIAWDAFQAAYGQKLKHIRDSEEIKRMSQYVKARIEKFKKAGIDVTWCAQILI